MKILLTVNSLEIGGAQTFLIRLANELVRRKQQVYIFDHVPERSQAALIELLSPEVKVYSTQLPNFLEFLVWKCNALMKRINPQSEFRDWFRKKIYQWRIRLLNPDLINSHSFEADWLSSQYIGQQAFVISMHGEYELGLSKNNTPELHRRSRKILERAQAIAYPADKNLEIFQYHQPEDLDLLIKKLYYGFPKVSFQNKQRADLGISKEAMVYGLVARGQAEKGWEEALKAFIALQKQFPQRAMHLIFVGDSPYLEALKAKNQDQKQVHFVGFAKQPLEWISIFDIGLLPTFFAGESLPNSIIEYLYCGKPVISTYLGEIQHMIDYQGEKAGILVDFDKDGRPNILALQAAMAKYLEEKTFYKQQASIASLAFQKFDMERCGQEYIEVYERSLEKLKSPKK